MLDEVVAVQHCMHGALRRQMRAGELLPQLLADLRRAPPGIFAFQAHDHRFELQRQSIGLPIRSSAAIAERLHAAVFIPVENLVAGLPRYPELGAQRRHLLALEQAGDKPKPLVHDVTLLPRHAPSALGGKVSPMCPVYGVTYLSGRTCDPRDKFGTIWRTYSTTLASGRQPKRSSLILPAHLQAFPQFFVRHVQSNAAFAECSHDRASVG